MRRILKKKKYLEMFPMGRRCHHDSCRRMQRVSVEHFDHVLFVSLHDLYEEKKCISIENEEINK